MTRSIIAGFSKCNQMHAYIFNYVCVLAMWLATVSFQCVVITLTLLPVCKELTVTWSLDYSIN